MTTAQLRRNSLTAHLARAAGAVADAPTGDAQREGHTADAPVVREGMCTISVAPGQHCPRPAVDGQTICRGHAAMGSK